VRGNLNYNESIPSIIPPRRQPWNKGKRIGAKPPIAIKGLILNTRKSPGDLAASATPSGEQLVASMVSLQGPERERNADRIWVMSRGPIAHPLHDLR
jgi:hypothetical protein